MRYEMTYGYAGDDASVRVASDAKNTVFTALEDAASAAYWVSYTLHAPADSTYIMIPACAYDGNRFEAVHRQYPPMFTEEEFGLDVPVRMTEVPRLSREGDSFMDVTTGDMAAPCVCVLDRIARRSFILEFGQQVQGLNLGVTLEQRGDELTITLRAPAARRLVYRWYEGYPSLRPLPEADAPMAVRAGDEIRIAHRVHAGPCRDVPQLYEQFFALRAAMADGARAHASAPFSHFFADAEREYDRTHFIEAEGMYALNAQDERDTSVFGQWQAGWVGGGMSTLPLMCEGSALSRERAVRTLLFAARMQSKAGFYYGIAHDGRVHHDCFGHFEDRHCLLLIRKHADLTYFMFKQIIALEAMGERVPEEVRASAVRAADALVKLWRRYGQLGQFVNCETGEIKVGGSASGGIAPAALCAAARVTGSEDYARAAREIARHYYATAIARGVTTGGPGEILQAPDSESIAGLLESYVCLYEAEPSSEWLDMARDAAQQMSSWIVPYDYAFPAESYFGRLGIRSAGSVWANVQNKHSAPGLCTLSPAAYLKLFRATGDVRYLEIMRQVARFMPQVASRADRPIRMVQGGLLDPGEMCERVNMSDWEGTSNVGDSIFGGSAWPEVSLMLTWLEIPGVYCLPARGIVCAADHVNARLEGGRLVISNPTAYDACVKVMIEDEESVARPLGLYWQGAFRRVAVAAGESVRVEI